MCSFNRPSIRVEIDNEVVVLLSCPTLSVVLSGLLELNALKGVLGLGTVAARLRGNPAVRVDGLTHGAVAGIEVDVVMVRVLFRHHGHRPRGVDGPFVALWGVLNQFYRVLIVVRDNCRQAHCESNNVQGVVRPRHFELSRDIGYVWRQGKGGDRGEVISSIAGPFLVGQEKPLVDDAVDANVDSGLAVVLVRQRTENLDFFERWYIVLGRSVRELSIHPGVWSPVAGGQSRSRRDGMPAAIVSARWKRR